MVWPVFVSDENQSGVIHDFNCSVLQVFDKLTGAVGCEVMLLTKFQLVARTGGLEELHCKLGEDDIIAGF